MKVLSRAPLNTGRSQSTRHPSGSQLANKEIIYCQTKDAQGGTHTSRYEKGKFLGKGGFAKCYVATSVDTRKNYALKIVPKASLMKRKARQKFQSEIRIHRSLSHEHVVGFRQYFEDAENSYILLELCHNNSMSELLKRRNRLTEVEARYYSLQLVEAIQYLHANGVIHRDLKLGNLFIDKTMSIKVGDFGLAAKLESSEERKRTVCGTPNYIAPEILEGKTGHSFEVDLWSLGVIIYTMMVGKPPYESRDVKATYRRILSNTYSFPSHIHMSPEAQDLIQALLQLRPDRRLSIAEVRQHPFFTGSSSSPMSQRAQDVFLPPTLPHMSLYHSPQDSDLIEAAHQWRAKQQEAADQAELEEEKQQREEPSDLVKRPRDGSSRPSNDENVNPNNNQRRLRSREPLKQVQHQNCPETEGRGRRGDSNRVLASVNIDRNANAPSVRRPSGTSSRRQGDGREALGRLSHNTNANVVPLRREKKASHGFSSRNNREMDEEEEEATSSSSPQSSPSSRRSSVTPEAPPRKKKKAWTSAQKRSENDSPFDIYCENKCEEEEEEEDMNGEEVVQVWREKQDSTRSRSAPPRSSTKKREGRRAMYTEDPDDEGEMESKAKDNHRRDRRHRGHDSEEEEDDMAERMERQLTLQATKPSSRRQTEREEFHTPDAQRLTQATVLQRDLGTLETLHSKLNGRSTPVVHRRKRRDSNLASVTEQAQIEELMNSQCAWVVKHIDYTSKYGVGFLLSDGTVGVYFNDSTKIIMRLSSLEITHEDEEEEEEETSEEPFWYIERRRDDQGNRLPDHVIDTHAFNRYPEDLSKKVKLLKHFKNHLLADLDPAKMHLRSGVTSSVPEASVPVYIKKWVKTRHAILFRLSNSTVQVIFTDDSEIQLSSEAKALNFIDKRGSLETLSLMAVNQSQRPDIAKRLKYTKDLIKEMLQTPSKSASSPNDA